MSTQTEHLQLDLREAADIFNPLSTNANFESLDSIIYEIQTKGGVPTYTTTASANLLKLSQNPTPNVTVFKFVAAGDANTWSYQETVNNIVALDGTQKTVKAGEMYVAWVNSANAMVVIAWPDVVNAQTFDGKGPAEWATKVQLDAVNQTAANATQTAQAAATVANNALEAVNSVGNWVKMNFTPEADVTVIKNDCYFNQKLKIASFNLILTGNKINQLAGMDNVDVGTFTNWPTMNSDTITAMYYLTSSSAGTNYPRQFAVPVDAIHFDKFNISKISNFPYTGLDYTQTPRYVSVTGIALLS